MSNAPPSHASRLLGNVLLSTATFCIFLLGWEAIVRGFSISKIVLPAPSAVALAFWESAREGELHWHLAVTVYEVLAGFVVGSAGGLILGFLIALSPLLERIFYPYVVAFQVMPKVVLAPIFITWFGLGIESKIVMAIAISFFPVVINTVVGLESVEENAMLLMRSLVASRRQIFWKLAWPAALPSIFAGLKTSLTLALIGALVAEFVTAKDGLGTLIITFSFELKVYLVFAVIVVVSVLGLALYGIMEYLDRKVVFWRQSHFTG